MALTYDLELRVMDPGARTARLILHLPEEVGIEAICPDTFSVYEDIRDPAGEQVSIRDYRSGTSCEAQGYRSVLAAYPSDAQGEPKRKSCFLTLELDPAELLGIAVMGFDFLDCRFTVTQNRMMGGLGGLVFDLLGETRCPQVARWTNVKGEGGKLNYAYFTPEAQGERPLIIWLHGAGEGGYDPRVAYMGNNVVNLASPQVQGYFGGAWVLAPQCATMWMDDGSHAYGRSGKSMYTQELMALLEFFAAAHPVDRSRIYIGGCSNGGFMTMRMLLDHPDFFAAAFPICEALYDETISDEALAVLRNKPIWFLHAMTDPIVPPAETALPTYQRLKALGAENIHFTYIDDHPPRPMVGHGAWIPGLQDAENYDFDGSPVLVNGTPVTRLQWLAAQKREETIKKR